MTKVPSGLFLCSVFFALSACTKTYTQAESDAACNKINTTNLDILVCEKKIREEKAKDYPDGLTLRTLENRHQHLLDDKKGLQAQCQDNRPRNKRAGQYQGLADN